MRRSAVRHCHPFIITFQAERRRRPAALPHPTLHRWRIPLVLTHSLLLFLCLTQHPLPSAGVVLSVGSVETCVQEGDMSPGNLGECNRRMTVQMAVLSDTQVSEVIHVGSAIHPDGVERELGAGMLIYVSKTLPKVCVCVCREGGRSCVVYVVECVPQCQEFVRQPPFPTPPTSRFTIHSPTLVPSTTTPTSSRFASPRPSAVSLALAQAATTPPPAIPLPVAG